VEHNNRRSLKNRFTPRSLLPALGLAFGIAAVGGVAKAQPACTEVTVNTALENANIQDANKQPAQIPSFGEKVLLILYTDPDVADQNDPFADQVKAQNLDKNYFQSIGIANMADAPAKPNWIIRAIIRSKIKKYNVSILADADRSLPNQWKLCDCNNKSVVLLIGKDKKLKYFKKGALSDQETKNVIDLIKKQIAEAGGPAS
jgi:predicted transcriptional regulator